MRASRRAGEGSVRRTRLRLQVGMAGREGTGNGEGDGRKEAGREGRREGGGGRQVARLESGGVKRSPSHFCSSASPAEGLHAQPPPPPRPFPTQLVLPFSATTTTIPRCFHPSILHNIARWLPLASLTRAGVASHRALRARADSQVHLRSTSDSQSPLRLSSRCFLL